MPRTPPPRTDTIDAGAALERVNSVLASAAQLTSKNMVRPKSVGGGSGAWQNECWYFYDTVGEFRFGVNWKAQALSQCELVILEEDGAGDFKTVTDGIENELLGLLFGGDAGQSQALASMALQLDVPGEFHLVGEVLDEDGRPDPNGTDTWNVYSSEEFKEKGRDTGQWELDRGDGKKRTINEDDAWVIRVWRAHPRKWVEADSPARASLPILREIENVTKKIAAEIDSRLAGAGILFVPTEMTFSGAAKVATGRVTSDEDDPPGAQPIAQEDVNEFLTNLMEAMITPIANRDHPSAVVPVIVKAPGALLDKVQHIKFSDTLDKRNLELRDAALGRLAVTADMPADIITGLSDVNHWTSWQLEESAIKVHIEPLGEVITSALTQKWAKVAAKALGVTWNPKRRIGLDTSSLRLRPDRSAQALELHARLALSNEALLRECGFEPSDEPSLEEVKAAIIKKLATDSAAGIPELVLAAVKALFSGQQIDLSQVEVSPAAGMPRTDGAASGEQPDAEPTPIGPPATEPDAEEPPAQAAAAQLNGAEAAVLAAAELLVQRAIERANNRVNNRRKDRRPVPADQLDAALQGAWDHAARVAELLGLDVDWFVDRLDTYARGVLTSGEDHQAKVLARVLGS